MSTSEILQSLRDISALVANYADFEKDKSINRPIIEDDDVDENYNVRQKSLTSGRQHSADGHCRRLSDGGDRYRGEWKEDTRYFLTQTLDSDRTFLRRGSVRGVKDGVKTAIERLILQTRWKKNYEELDRGKIVIYMTSLGVVRRTWEKCRRAVAILENHRCYYERRDLNLCQKFVDELKNRCGQQNATIVDLLPTVFIDGHLFGAVDKLEQWSEVGELKTVLEPYKRTGGKLFCSSCYGFRFLPCPSCRGGKKSNVVCQMEEITLQLRCARCDSCGLVECSECSDGYTTDDNKSDRQAQTVAI